MHGTTRIAHRIVFLVVGAIVVAGHAAVLVVVLEDGANQDWHELAKVGRGFVGWILFWALATLICAEAAGLLKDQRFSPNVGAVIRKMKPTRQIECVELMVATNNVTVTYANALLAATPAAMLVNERKPKKLAGVSAEQMAKMEKEMGNLQGQYKSIEHTYGQDVLNLVLAKGYLKTLLDNEAVFRFLSMRHSDVLREFSNLVEVEALDK